MTDIPKRVYLAAPYCARDYVGGLIPDLAVCGWASSSSWLLENHEINAGTIDDAPQRDHDDVKEHVRQDLVDVATSQALILFTESYLREQMPDQSLPMTSGGRHVETGYAMALGLDIIVVGKPENIFHRGYDWAYSALDWEQALKILDSFR